METFDFAIIGAGPAGEAAAFKARELGASVAIVDRGWFGGSCPHIGCLPSKSLLDGAARHARNPATYDWPRASAARDFMVNRPPDAAEPDDSSHLAKLREAGAVAYRGTGTIADRGRLDVEHDGTVHELAARNIVVAVGSVAKRPPIEGLDQVPIWTNREAMLTRELPRSLVILGGGPTGCEVAQVFVRFGVPTTIVQSGPRLAPTDHPRNSQVVRAALERDGVKVRLGVRALRARRGATESCRRSSSWTTAPRPTVTPSCSPSAGRSRSRTSGSSTTASTPPVAHRSRATGACGSPTACGSSATRPGPSCTPTRPTTRAS
jgi:pyruvate/2-oxoglutarate dehydrogenase complex dihydrolipoamide dehydrogenase (E3) component